MTSSEFDLHVTGPAPAGPDAPSEPCPTPLAWREVLQTFADDSQVIEAATSAGPIRGVRYGCGPPLYFLNGLSGDQSLFALTAYLLREEAACVLFDYPDRPSSPSKLVADLAKATRELADGLRHDRFTLYATGFGGLPALQLMHDAPGRVRSALLQGAFAHRNFRRSERMLFSFGRRLPGPLQRVPGWASVQQQNHRLWFPPFDPSRWDFLKGNLGSSKTAAVSRRAVAMANADLRPLLNEIPTPVLILRTEGEGRAATAAQQELAAGLRHSRIEWMHTCGHYPHLTHPHRLAKLIRSVLASGGCQSPDEAWPAESR